jgi:hypothetical protein
MNSALEMAVFYTLSEMPFMPNPQHIEITLKKLPALLARYSLIYTGIDLQNSCL